MGDALAGLVERTLGERAAANAAIRTGQIGAQVLRSQQDPVADDRFALVHLTPNQETRALQEYMYAHKPLAETPELFYGPFMQLGTRLQLGPKWVQFVVDTVTDPATYALAGSGGLIAKATKGAVGMTLGGRVARLAEMLGKGAAEVGGAAVLDEAERALSAAGKILGSGKREAMLQAARTGDAAFKGLVDEALRLGEGSMDEGIKTSLNALRRDRKGLAWMLDHTDEIIGYEKLPAAMIPQKGVFSQIATGQARPFIEFSIPSINPVNLTRQLVGIGYQGEKFYTPFAKSILSRGARSAVGDVTVLSGHATGQVGHRFVERPYSPGDVTVKDFDYTLNHMEAALASPLDRPNVRAAEELPFNKKVLNQLWSALPPESRKVLSKDEFAAKVYNQQRRSLLDADKARLSQRQSIMDRLANEAEQAAQPFGPPAPGVGAELAQAGEIAGAQVRRFGDMFSVENLIREGASRDFHLQLSGNLRQITQWSSFVDGQGRDILIRNTGGLAQADEVDSVLRYVRESPGSWEKRVVNGHERLFLKDDAVKAGSLFSDILSLSQGGGLRNYLTTQGLPPEIVQMTERIGQSLDIIGANLKTEKALLGFLDAYWPAVFKRSSAFGRRFGEGSEGWSALSNKVLYDPESLADIAPDLLSDMRRIQGRARAQKVSVQEVRAVADDLRAALEKAGYGTYEKSGLKTFAHALDAYGKALYERRLFDEFGALAGHAPYEDLPKNLKKVVTADAWNAVDKNGVSHVRDVYGDGQTPPENVRAAFMEIKLRSGAPKLVSDAEAARRSSEILVDEVRAKAIEDLAAGRATDLAARQAAEARVASAEKHIPLAARAQVARDLSGVKQIKAANGDVLRIRVARVRENVPGSIEGTFDADWVLSKSYPEHLRYGKEIAAEVERRVAREEAKMQAAFARHRENLAEAYAGQRAVAVKGAHGRVSEARRLTEKETQRIIAKEANKAPSRATVWVRKDLANHFIEPLSLWEQQGLNKASMQALGRLNAALKSTTLLGDVFHLHSITMNQLAGGGPAQFFKFLLDPQGRLLPGVEAGAFGQTERFARLRQQAVVGAGIGAAAGAGAGAAFGGDAGDIAALSLTGALYGAALGAARLNEAWGKRLSLSPDGFEFLYWMGKGGWTGRPDDRSIGMASRWLQSFRDDLIRKYPDSFLISPIDGLRHINDVWEKELWGTAHNGGKHWLFSTIWNDELGKLERRVGFSSMKPVEQEQAKEALARQTMQFVNNAMGGQNVAALLAHPSWQHYARWGLLAPDWTESRIQMAAGFFHGLDPIAQGLVGAGLGTAIEAAEAGFDPDEMTGMGLVGGAGLGILAGKWSQRVASRLMTAGDVTAKRARKATGTALLSLFVVGNLLNKALSGHWLWENEEGKKTSIQLPGRTESGRQRYLSFGKQWLEAFEFAGISEKDGFALPVFGRTQSKLAPTVSWTLHMLMNDNRYGTLATADDSALERIGNVARFSADAVTPIIIQGPLRLAGAAVQGEADLGGVAEAAVRFGGFPLSRSPYPMSPALPARGFFNAIRPLPRPTLESKLR